SYYPNYRELLLETDRTGRKRSFLASEDDFQFIRSLESHDALIPVVGDVSGKHALAAIGEWMTQHNEKLGALYISNVENYLFRGGSFDSYMDNLKRLPHSNRTLVIRSIFGGYGLREAVPGYYSISTVQPLSAMLADYAAGKYQSYADLLRR